MRRVLDGPLICRPGLDRFIADMLQRERALLYVAASRARDALMITLSGEPSELLPAQ